MTIARVFVDVELVRVRNAASLSNLVCESAAIALHAKPSRTTATATNERLGFRRCSDPIRPVRQKFMTLSIYEASEPLKKAARGVLRDCANLYIKSSC